MNENTFVVILFGCVLLSFALGWLRGAAVTTREVASDFLHKPVYIKCRDCGLEHAVYRNGKVHALRPEPKTPPRRPGIED